MNQHRKVFYWFDCNPAGKLEIHSGNRISILLPRQMETALINPIYFS